MSKPRFSKRKCLECTWHGERGPVGYPVKDENGETRCIYCNYATLNKDTCLRAGENNSVADIRGDDYKKCRQFLRGKARREE